MVLSERSCKSELRLFVQAMHEVRLDFGAFVALSFGYGTITNLKATRVVNEAR